MPLQLPTASRPTKKSWPSLLRTVKRHECRAPDRQFQSHRTLQALEITPRLWQTFPLTMPEARSPDPTPRDYSTAQLVRRLLALAWRFRVDCVVSLFLSVGLLLLGLAGLQLLGTVIDV